MLRRTDNGVITNRPQMQASEVLRARAANVSDLVGADLRIDRVVVVTDRIAGLWENFTSPFAVGDGREVKVEFIKPRDLQELEVKRSDMVLLDRVNPNELDFTDEKVVAMFKSENLKAAGYLGIWAHDQAKFVTGLPALAQSLVLQASKTTQSPVR